MKLKEFISMLKESTRLALSIDGVELLTCWSESKIISQLEDWDVVCFWANHDMRHLCVSIKQLGDAAVHLKNMNTSIISMGVSDRVINILRRNGFEKVSDLEYLRYEDYMHIKGIGRKGVEELENVLKEYGIEIKE